jgi:YNFM family putative membrane transporter
MSDFAISEEKYIESGTRTYRQTNLAFFAAGFVTFISLYDVQPLLPAFSHEFGLAPALGSLPLSVSTCALAITMLFAGTLSETWGRKRIMATALFLTSLLAILTAFSHSFESLLLIRLVQGVVLAGVPSVAMAYLSEEISPSSIGSAMGLYISGNAIGGMTGRIFTAAVTDYSSWRTALGIIGIFCFALSVYFVKNLPPSTNLQRRPFQTHYLFTSLWHNLKDPGLLCLYAIAFTAMGGFITLYNYITFRLLAPPYSLTQTEASMIFLVYLLGSFSSTLMGHLSNRFGKSVMICIALAMMAVGTVMTLANPITWIIGGVAVFTTGFFGTHSIASSWLGRRAKTAKAQASSLYLFFYYLGSSLSGTIGGVFWMHFGWQGVAAMIGLLILLTFVFTIRLAFLQDT